MSYKIPKGIAVKFSVLTIIVNLLLSGFKLVAGLVANSGALISDAVHSASDVLSTFVVLIGLKLSARKSDVEHRYGHERVESVAAIILSVVLLATGVGIGYNSFLKIISGNYDGLDMPGTLALWAAVVSIVVKEIMYHMTKAVARSENSPALMADAWHHRSDALSSVGSFIGVFGAMLGFKVLDPVAGFVICIFIAKSALDIFKDATDRMIDKSCDDETEIKIANLIRAIEGVENLDDLKTRIFGSKIYVDVEIAADGAQSLADAHKIAEKVHYTIENEIEQVKHCMVHVNPVNKI